MTEDQKEFDERIAAEQAVGIKKRLENAPPIGMREDGTIALLQPDAKDLYEPTVVYGDERDEDLDDVSDLDDEP